jgi:aerobic carbon-monoxide dehydrogenase large subunit
LPLAEIGRIGHCQLAVLPKGAQPILSHTWRFHLADDLYIFTNGVHGAHVEVNTDTGFVKLLKHWVVDDCGRVINPQLADEQVRGGRVQGLGGASMSTASTIKRARCERHDGRLSCANGGRNA